MTVGEGRGASGQVPVDAGDRGPWNAWSDLSFYFAKGRIIALLAKKSDGSWP